LGTVLERPIATPARTTAQHIKLENAGVRYVLLTESQRTIKGRLLGLFGQTEQSAQFWAIRNVSLQITPGEIVGVVGRNGSGKSTLLRVIGGVIQPTTGTVAISGSVSPLLDLFGPLHADLTGRENAYLYGAIFQRTREQMDEIMPQIVAFSELGPFFDIPVKAYSSGMVARLGFSIGTQLQPEILLLDEVLAVGDEQFQKKSFFRIRKLIDKGTMVVIVSHSAAQIEQLCNRAIYMNRGEIIDDDKPKSVIAHYQRDLASAR